MTLKTLCVFLHNLSCHTDDLEGVVCCPWYDLPPGTPVSSTRKLISSSSFHRLDMTLAVAEALNPNKTNKQMTLKTLSCPSDDLEDVVCLPT